MNANCAERLVDDAVAERDREWQASIGISALSGPADVRPAFDEAKQRWVDDAVAEERLALREIITGTYWGTYWPSVQKLLLAALDAREKS
jgi:hypothetical protein